MVKKNKNAEEKDAFKSVESTLSRAENFIEQNQKAFIYGLSGLLLVILLIIGYYKFIREPRIQESWSESFKAEMYFERDSFKLALNGDGLYPGFLDIIDDYGSTLIGKLSRYYAGVCYMRTGDYESAIENLKKFKSKDEMISAMALGLIGDAYIELNDLEKALDYYLDAAKKADNDLLTPIFLMKAGRTCELLNDYKQALEIYRKIDKDYYDTPQQREIEKYITRAELKASE